MKSCFKYYVLLFYLNFIEGSFRCDYFHAPKAKAWFKVHQMPENWFDARLRCSLEGAVLAAPTSPEIFDVMKTILINSTSETIIHTGYHATFSQGDYYSIEGRPLTEFLATWAMKEPDNKDNIERCITINGLGQLADGQCEETRSYICYHNETIQEVDSECGTDDPDYHLDKRTNKCYKLHTVPRNFSRAFLACSAEDGHLAIINSETEATVLRELFAKYPDAVFSGTFRKDIAFIGGHDWGEKWDWRTIHGQTLTEAGYSKFSPGEPNNTDLGQSCIGIFRTALLADLWCDRPIPFICEKTPGVCYPQKKG